MSDDSTRALGQCATYHVRMSCPEVWHDLGRHMHCYRAGGHDGMHRAAGVWWWPRTPADPDAKARLARRLFG